MRRFPFPKEHGAYVVLIAAWLLGIIYSPFVDVLGFALSLILSASIFLLQGPLIKILRRRNEKLHLDLPISIVIVIAIASGILLGIRSPQIVLLGVPLLFIALLFFFFIRKRSSPTELSLIGFAGLSLTTPLVMISSNGHLSNVHLFALWLFATLFFCGSVLCVDIRFSGKPALDRALFYHYAVLAIVLVLVAFKELPNTAIIVMILALSRVLFISIYHKGYMKLAIKDIGILESIVTLLAVIVSALPFLL